VEHVGAAVDRIPQCAGVDLGDREQLQVERGDDAEVAASAA
jgi:hypothetical protein